MAVQAPRQSFSDSEQKPGQPLIKQRSDGKPERSTATKFKTTMQIHGAALHLPASTPSSTMQSVILRACWGALVHVCGMSSAHHKSATDHSVSDAWDKTHCQDVHPKACCMVSWAGGICLHDHAPGFRGCDTHPQQMPTE